MAADSIRQAQNQPRVTFVPFNFRLCLVGNLALATNVFIARDDVGRGGGTGDVYPVAAGDVVLNRHVPAGLFAAVSVGDDVDVGGYRNVITCNKEAIDGAAFTDRFGATDFAQDFDNSAVGMILKSHNNNATASTEFNYGEVGTIDPVPEPSTGLLAGLAGLSLAFRRRRK